MLTEVLSSDGDGVNDYDMWHNCGLAIISYLYLCDHLPSCCKDTG